MYSIAKYRDIISSRDADTIRRFEMIKQLSRGFTVENATALEMDRLLTEQLDLETGGNGDGGTGSDRTAAPSKPRASRPAAAISADLEQQFRELFDALKDQQPRLIRYDLPRVATVEMEKPEIDAFQQIVDDVVMGSNVMLIGGAGTGKTYLAETLIAHKALAREHMTINCSQWTSPTEIIGGQTMDGYQEGKLIEAWKNGYVLVLDELPKLDANTAGLFNDALAKTRVPNAVIFNARRESFTKHPDFACIATGNVYPNKESMAYGANNKQDLSLLDRFSGSVYFIEKNPKIERAILQNFLIWSLCDKLRSAVEELKYEAQLSLRFMVSARDAFLLEMQRSKETGRNAIGPNEGKTFKSAVDSYLSTFTEVQQQNLRQKINYSGVIEQYQYRKLQTGKSV